MRIALHSCCGPCSIEVVDFHRDEGDEPTLVYYNPNIQPVAEYERRLDTVRDFADVQGAALIELPYDGDAWEREVGVHGTDRAARCRACFRVRFDGVAAYAVERGFDAIATTLSVSPYQSTEAIREELEAAGERHGIEVRFVDHRARYADATRRSRAEGMYRQNYCGCRFSEAEAAAEREARRRERAARRGGA